MKLVDLLLQQIEQAGAQQIFGIPGDFVLPLFLAIEQSGKIPLYYLSHEPSAIFAADGAARISNKPSVAVLTYGAGALNAVNAVAQAYMEQVPLIIIAGFPSEQELKRELVIHHQARHVDSQRDIYKEITCAQVRLDDVNTAAAELSHAIHCCLKESRPILIEMPRDASAWVLPAIDVERADPKPCNALIHSELQHQQLLAVAAEEIKRRLVQAKKPVLLCGIGVRRFGIGALVEQLSSQLNIPMMTTLLGRACVDQLHPMYAGVFIDSKDQSQYELIRDADLIIQLGVIQSDSNFAAHQALFPIEKSILVQQGELRMAGFAFHDLTIRDLLSILLSTDLPSFSVQAAKQNRLKSRRTRPANNFNSANAVAAVDEILSQHSSIVPVVSDIGDCLFASLHLRSSTLLAPSFYASMGYAVPAALGVQAATGLRPLVLVGDGAFQMTGLELGHCTRYGFAPIILLFNNSSWQMIKAFSPDLSSTCLQGWDYSVIAKGMGGESHQVRNFDELEQAMTMALQQPTKFTLIELILPVDSRSERLQAFANGFLAAQKKALPTIW